jgi:hypothetical protein
VGLGKAVQQQERRPGTAVADAQGDVAQIDLRKLEAFEAHRAPSEDQTS